MSDEKKQNPFEAMGLAPEEADIPPAYTPPGPSSQQEQEQEHVPSTSAPKKATGSSSSTKKPIAIPAITSAFDSPFIRAYAPILKSHNFPKESFLTFLDQLNKDISSSPPLQVLDATGGILSSVPILFPLHWIGSAVSGLANLGSQGVSKSRTDSSIKTANKDIFGPRGLKVGIAKLDALAHLAGIPILDSQGKINRQAPLLLQLQNAAGVVGQGQSDDGSQQQQQDVDVCQRRIQALGPWIAELEFDILPWSSKSRLTRFNAALKKSNASRVPEEDLGRRQRDRRDAFSNEEKTEDEVPFRKGLWLVIREVEKESS
ncbi:hypothetical protein N7508_003137 [Penicillium antarcticum]|uniref:uncharacterized protein n=1 Tax=Penicillium antarcticum TaxID=416450 RepID=UPI0023870BA7|nr:uncharacterized protein N7508_003137 [Penicillium antarcticum]KAJ5312307.1 hypothetical protein N7508_003137 [Penicillium antarcticum]